MSHSPGEKGYNSGQNKQKAQANALRKSPTGANAGGVIGGAAAGGGS